MTTLHDLRTTLDDRAATVADRSGVTSPARVAAVRGRARAIRRRRAASVATAVALVVGGVGVATTLPGDQRPPVTDRTLGSLEAPAVMTSLGSTYRFGEGVAGERRIELEIPAADAPRLATWGGADGDVRVTFREDGPPDLSSSPGDFSDYTVLPPGGRFTLVVRGRGEVAAAVYPFDEPADGDTLDGLTWRDRVGDQTRVASVHGEPGDTSVSMEVPAGARDDLVFSDYCRASERGWVAVLEVDGSRSWGTCPVLAGRDDNPGVGAITVPPARSSGERDGTLTVRAWVVSREDARARDLDAPAESAPVRLGAASYRPDAPVTRLAGWDVPELVEDHGHLWRYVESTEAVPARLEVSAAEGPRLVSAFSRGGRAGRMRILVDGEIVMQSTVGGASEAVAVVGEGTQVVEVRGDVRDAGLAVYERVG